MLHPDLLADLLDLALATGADFAEFFVEKSQRSQLVLVNGEVDKTLSGLDAGIGIRLLQGDRCIYTFSNDFSPEALRQQVRETAAALSGSQQAIRSSLLARPSAPAFPVLVNPFEIAKPRKVDLMRLANRAAMAYDPLISQTRVVLSESSRQIQLANSDGLLTEDSRTYSRLMIEAVASANSEKQSGYHGPGARQGYEFIESLDVEALARDAARIARTILLAKPCPAGRMPVIIDNGFGGVIFHEACGHALEATALARHASVFQDKLGQQIASPLVTAIDDATIPLAWGSLTIDDEGAPAQRNVLIDKGILTSYLVDRHNGRKIGLPSTGSGRRESYRFAPTSRMSNTYIAGGDSSPESIIKDTAEGLYARSMGGGSVDPANGEFNFAVQEAYMIRNGEIAEPVRGATLIGKGADVLMRIDRVGNNLTQAQGMCGSISGSIPTNVGQPMIRVSELTVGGRGTAE
jgi:TldD protein